MHCWEKQHREGLVLFVSCHLSSDAKQADTDGASTTVNTATPADTAPLFNSHTHRHGFVQVRSRLVAFGSSSYLIWFVTACDRKK